MYKTGNISKIFPTTIYEAEWENFSEVKNNIIQRLQPYFKNSIAEGNEYVDKNGDPIFKRTIPMLQLYPEFADIAKFVDYHGKQYWKELGFTEQQEPYVLQLWANEVPPGGFTPSHNHNPVAVGGAFYIDADPKMGNIHLENPNQMVLGRMPYDWQKKPYLYTHEVPIYDGKIIMFPGYLMHHVRSNMSGGNRIVIGFNFGLSWNYKSKEEQYGGQGY